MAYCKTDAPNSDEIECYLDNDLEAWDADTNYMKGDWVLVAGVDYKSLEDNNINHQVTGTDNYWEAGTKSVTVKVNISNGTSLDKAMPYLNRSDPVTVTQIGGVWYIPGAPFNGAVVRA